MSTRGSRRIAATLAAALLLVPSLADARVGGGGSMGSRGSNTNSAPPATRTAPNAVAPMEHTATPQAPPMQGRPAMPAQPMAPQPARSGFMSGLMGGLVGAGIGAMLFGGGSFFGHGLGIGGFIGFLFQIFLVAMVGWLLWRWLASRRTPAMAGGPAMFAPGEGPPQAQPMGQTQPMGGGGGYGHAVGGQQPLDIAPADYQQFEHLLKATQAAWSARDLHALREMATPEMAGYFAEQLSGHASRGVTNTVTDVSLQSGDLSQAWAEGDREYATVAMRFSMIDVTKDGLGRVVDGSPAEHVTATEVWTFVRPHGGRWILSAIQQAR